MNKYITTVRHRSHLKMQVYLTLRVNIIAAMVKIGLQIRATLEFVTGLRADGDDFRYYLKLKCANCGEVPDHWQYVSMAEKQPVKGGRGDANCVSKCKLCSRENSLDILEASLASYDAKDSGNWKTIVAMDCRGMEPVEFSPRNGWAAKGYKEDEDGEGQETGTAFEDVDLSDKDWADYDEKSSESTVISEFEAQFVKLK